MSNLISYSARPDLPQVRMANGQTAMVMSVLALAASHVAQTASQCRWAAFLASHDQSVDGIGFVYSDLSQWPWSVQHLEAEKTFLRQTIDAAIHHQNWERLSYMPSEEHLLPCVARLLALVNAFALEDLDESQTLEERWRFVPEHPQQCEKHGTYMHEVGCIICGDK